MNADSIAYVINALTGEKVEYSRYQSNVSISCPLAPYTHKKGTDRSKGFTIKVDPMNVSPGYCWSCKFKGNLYQLADELTKLSGVSHQWFRDIVSEHETPSYDSILQYIDYEEPYMATKYIPDDVLKSYPLLSTEKSSYRKLTSQTLDELQIRIDKDSKRIIFPLLTSDGTVGLAGRTYVDDKIKYLNYNKFSKGRFLFMQQTLTTLRRVPILLVEGQIDACYCYQVLRDSGRDMRAVSPMGSDLTTTQVKLLLDYATSVYVFFDNDRAGRAGTFKVIEKLLPHLPLYSVAYPIAEKDPEELSPQDLLWHIDHMVPITDDKYELSTLSNVV